MWWAALPPQLRTILIGVGLAALLLGMGAGYVARERAAATKQEQERAELEYHRNNQATREILNQVDRSLGDADKDHVWLCDFYDIDCVLETPTD